MSRIACIGSRSTPPNILKWMEEAGAGIARAGHVLVSGNATGADQAWARGGNSVDPTKVELCLPWEGFEEQAIAPGNVVRVLDLEPPQARAVYEDIATSMGGVGKSPSSSVMKLFARNAMIIAGPLKEGSAVRWNRAAHVLAYGVDKGGTKRACRIAKRWQIQIWDVSLAVVRDHFDMTAVNGAIFP